MIYDFTCDTCLKTQEIKVSTWDIHTKGRHSLGIDEEKLSQRLSEPRTCKCGGSLKKRFTELGEPMFVKVDKQRFL